jgi:hypothetical protein
MLEVTERYLWCKIREGYLYHPEAQGLLGDLCKGKALKEVKLMDELFKYMQTQVYVPQDKLRLLVLEEEYASPISGHIGGKTPIEWCQGGVKEDH